jgi:hypothetical protein
MGFEVGFLGAIALGGRDAALAQMKRMDFYRKDD